MMPSTLKALKLYEALKRDRPLSWKEPAEARFLYLSRAPVPSAFRVWPAFFAPGVPVFPGLSHSLNALSLDMGSDFVPMNPQHPALVDLTVVASLCTANCLCRPWLSVDYADCIISGGGISPLPGFSRSPSPLPVFSEIKSDQIRQIRSNPAKHEFR